MSTGKSDEGDSSNDAPSSQTTLAGITSTETNPHTAHEAHEDQRSFEAHSMTSELHLCNECFPRLQKQEVRISSWHRGLVPGLRDGGIFSQTLHCVSSPARHPPGSAPLALASCGTDSQAKQWFSASQPITAHSTRLLAEINP